MRRLRRRVGQSAHGTQPAGVSAGSPKFWRATTVFVVLCIVAYTVSPIFKTPGLEPDDYRYLALVQQFDAGRVSFTEASIVENRWDAVWWLDASAIVRFYRPIVFASYWADVHLWGTSVITGLLVTNVFVHVVCCLLVAGLLLRLLGAGVPALFGSALFAAFWAHGEEIWYVAGRTDSIASMFFLTALRCHIAGRERPWLKTIAIPIWALALLTKESVAALPLVLLLYERWVLQSAGTIREICVRERSLGLGYALAAIVAWGLRAMALRGQAGTSFYPYLVMPWHAEFPGHLYTQWRAYSENLLLATETRPFLRLADLPTTVSWQGAVLAGIVVIGAVLWLRREPLFRWGVSMLVLTWAPASVSYFSERYLYLPSVAVALMAALCLRALEMNPRRRAVAAVIAVLWVGHQAVWLRWKHEQIMNVNPRLGDIVARKVAEIRSQIPRGSDVLVVNLHADWLLAQFSESIFRIATGDPTLRVRLLSTMPWRGDLGVLETLSQRDERTLILRGGVTSLDELPVQVRVRELLPWVSLAQGSRVTRSALGFSVEVEAGDEAAARVLRFTLSQPLSHYRVLRWIPGRSPRLTYRQLMESARFEIVRF